MKKHKEEWENPFIYNPYRRKKRKKDPFAIPPLDKDKNIDNNDEKEYQYYTIGNFFKRKFFK